MLGLPSALAKPCESRLTVAAADGLAEVGEVAQVAEVEFVDGGCAEGLGVAEGESWARPVVRASKPGTLAPLWATG
jgi:hypothetical protein